MRSRSVAAGSQKLDESADSLSFEDPDLKREYEALTNEEDREDFIQALRDLQETATDTKYSLEQASELLGLS